MAAAMFGALDKDKDGRLSRSEMQSLLDAASAHNKAQGVDEEADFFSTLDADSDGSVDQKEAAAFFNTMMSSGLMGEAKAGVGSSAGARKAARDEL